MSKDRSALRKALQNMEIGAPASAGTHPVQTLTRLSPDRGVVHIPLANIHPDPGQPRKFFDGEKLNELAASIREKGILQPLTVRPGEGSDDVIIIAGERRFRAAQLAGLDQVACLVRTGDDAHEIALIENVQRENLTALEEAEALERLKRERSYTDEKLAAVIGKSRVAVTETLRLNALPEAIKSECRAADIAGKTQLLQVLRAGPEEKQVELWEAIKSGRLPSSKAIRREQERAKQGTGRQPKHFRHTYKNRGATVSVTVSFQKTNATTDEIRSALQAAIDDLA